MANITVDELVAETQWLHRVARVLVKDDAAADDLTQDTFVLAANEAPTDGRPLRPWLARVLWNRIKVRTRSSKRRRDREERFGQLATPPVQPDEIVGRIELHRMLAAFVLALPVPQRDVLLLRFYEGLSSSQIGTRLGISASTVRWRLKSAVDELRAKLEEREPNRAWIATLMPLTHSATPVASSQVLGFAAVAVLLAIVGLAAFVLIQLNAQPASGTSTKREVEREHLAALTAAGGDRRASAPIEAVRTDGTLGTDRRRVLGKVIDASGAPVEGAEVTLDCDYRGDHPYPKQLTTRSGEFTFETDRECHYVVVATKGNTRGVENRMVAAPEDPVTITLLPAARGIVRVLDAETGAPVPNASLEVHEYFGSLTTATTNADGVARFDVATPVAITVTAAGYVQVRKTLDPRKGHEQAVAYFSFDNDAKDENRAEARLDIRVSRGIAFSGSVVSPEGNPAAGAYVHVAGPTTEDAPPQAYTMTDAGGRFEVTVTRGGRYKVWAESNSLTVAAPQRFEVAADGQTNAVVHLVARPELHGTVVDSAHRPVAGAHVSTADGRTQPVVTDAKGEFTFRVADDDAFDVIARHGTDSSEFQHLQVAYGTRGETILQIDSAGIVGTAVDRDGTPVPGAVIWLNGCCDDGNPSVVGGGSAVADATGKFTFDVPRGNFVLSVKRTVEDDFEDEDDVTVSGGTRNAKVVVP